MIEFLKLKHILEKNKSFLITTHVHPDGDAIGSEIALFNMLIKMKKECCVVNCSSTPDDLKFLDKENIIELFDVEKHSKIIQTIDVIIVADLNQLSRTIEMENVLSESKALKICIDHHEDPENFADYYFADSTYSATGEIVFDFLRSTEIIKPDINIAEPVYAAILTDTGSFKYEKTTPRTHEIVAELLRLGVVPSSIYQSIYEQNKSCRVHLLGLALSTIRKDDTGKLCYIKVTRKFLEIAGADENEVDGFVNHTLSIKGVRLGILFFELNDGIKISFRSKGNVSANKLASTFGGGGHFNAAGTRLFNVNFEEVMNDVIKKAKEFI